MSGEVSAIVSAFFWALSSAMLRSLTSDVPSLALNALRSLVGMVAYGAVILGTGRLAAFGDLTAKRLLFLTVNLGVGILLGDTIYYSSMRLIGLSRALTIASIYPLLTVVLAGIFLGEVFGPETYVGFVLCVGGVILVARSGLGGKGSDARVSKGKGVAFALTAAACWAVGAVALRQGSEAMDPYVVNFLRVGGVTMAAGLWARGRGEFRAVRRLSWSRVAILVIGAITGSVVGSVFYLTGVQMAGASKASVLNSTAPLFSVPMSLLTGEKLNWKLLAGMAAAISGVVIVLG